MTPNYHRYSRIKYKPPFPRLDYTSGYNSNSYASPEETWRMEYPVRSAYNTGLYQMEEEEEEEEEEDLPPPLPPPNKAKDVIYSIS